MTNDLVISKNKAKQAGRVLKRTDANKEDHDHALDTLSAWRSLHVDPLSLAYQLVKKYSDETGNNAYFGQRLKRSVSIIAKLKRFQSGLGEMQDIAGCRVIVSDYQKLLKLDKLLTACESIHKTQGKDYINNPKVDGYRGIHKIYKYDGSKLECKGLSVEIQLRTKLQHSWATAVEIIDLFHDQKLKMGQGSELWSRFFYLISNEFAKKEGLPALDNTDNYSELMGLIKQLDVVNRLNNYKVAFNHLSEESVDRFVLVWLKKKESSVQFISFEDQVSANEMYLAMESKYTNNENFDVVLVKTRSLTEFQASYPNYMADSTLFISELNKIMTT